MRVVNVALPDGRSYDVHVGSGARSELAAVLAAVAPKAKRAAIVSQHSIAERFGTVDAGISSRVFTIGSGEAFKTLSTVEELCREWSLWGMTRNDVVVAVGGGLVTDVGGFAASIYLRGVQVVYVSTTLLGMIDAAIGGKTGVNLPEGKNLVGTFWQPSAVLCDTDALATMPPRELRSGLGEMAKYHFLEGTPPLTRTPGGLESLPLEDRIARCVEIKAQVVAADEREGGLRAILNYGHTLAHALEIADDFEIMHGEAVAVGLGYAAEVALRLGRIDRARVDEHYRIVASHDLATKVTRPHSNDTLLALMGRDKKALDGITFVLDGPKGVESVTGIDPAILTDALEVVRG
jgi:5-deoxy-5-amino-3-dehydroquinate synthase